MTAEKERTKAGKFLRGNFVKNIISPLVRAGVKMVPVFGSPIVELVTTLTTPKGQPRKHTNLSQIIQWAIVGAVILDITINKGANLLAIIDLIGLLPSEVAEVSPVVQ